MLFAAGAVVHGLALAACIEGGVIFRDGQVTAADRACMSNFRGRCVDQ